MLICEQIYFNSGLHNILLLRSKLVILDWVPMAVLRKSVLLIIGQSVEVLYNSVSLSIHLYNKE
jgi:hypothetical protein